MQIYSKMNKNNLAIIYTTLENTHKAKELAAKAVEYKYAACVNLIPQGYAIYSWNDEIVQNQECLLIFKTTIENKEKLMKWLNKNHQYEVPCLLATTLSASQNFYDYVQNYINNLANKEK